MAAPPTQDSCLRMFWPVNDGGHSSDNVTDSKAWSTTANKSTESGSKDAGTESQGNDNKVGEAAEAE
ncbi:MAG: hypothetical protein ALECFALPRED_000261 [Alectoria fallacina]|uniref:Uncharacterized protein n=1 Tax=Alectoria fallacina TaxID=1903189 RepID=A0A8H3JA01_9LECA|nr:MAG: hypothetical protein ALECFALPRED_000261 [Alectoria fallacina]